jgi:hypothetical protein
MAEAAAAKLPPALTATRSWARLAVLNPDSLIPVNDGPADKVRAVHYEYIDFIVKWFGSVTGGGTYPRWIVEAHPEWGPMGL